MAEWEYRIVAFYLYDVPPQPSPASHGVDQPVPGLSKEFLANQFPDQYVHKKESNTALQIQDILTTYGRRGWQHYLQGQVGAHCLLYFRRRSDDLSKVDDASLPLSSAESAFLQKLDPRQLP